MATKHTFLLDLPDVLEAQGLNVWVANGYEYGQGNYLWTNPHTGVGSYGEKPFGYMVHHSASSSANPPSSEDSKASAWIGLLRDGKLYQEGGGVPTIYLASAGPARISSGYGYKPAAWDYTFKELRAPVKAQGSDGDTALNRYSFNMETVHRGDGTTLDPGVFDHVVGLGIALEQMCDLKEMTLGHRSWSQRKIDPYWNNDTDCIIEVQDRVAGDDDMTWADIVDDATWTKAYNDGFIEGDPNVMPDYYFADGPATEDEKKNAYNVIMQEQMERTK